MSRRKGGTQNLDAYQLQMRGVSAFYQNTPSSLDAAEEYFEQAITFDPNYGLAWMLLANTVGLEADNGFVDPTAGYGRARQLA